jgi:hypothetical protein
MQVLQFSSAYNFAELTVRTRRVKNNIAFKSKCLGNQVSNVLYFNLSDHQVSPADARNCKRICTSSPSGGHKLIGEVTSL